MPQNYRIGLIVPSSNVTMETEIPAMLRSRPGLYGERFTFHSSRMRMQSVTREELERMDARSEECAALLADARCDVQAYACLIGIMAQGPGYHEESEDPLHGVTGEEGGPAPVVPSAGALVLSSCVQVPSLEVIQAAEDRVGKPVFSASVATTWDVLRRLELSTRVDGCGRLLSGDLPGDPGKREAVAAD